MSYERQAAAQQRTRTWIHVRKGEAQVHEGCMVDHLQIHLRVQRGVPPCGHHDTGRDGAHVASTGVSGKHDGYHRGGTPFGRYRSGCGHLERPCGLRPLCIIYLGYVHAPVLDGRHRSERLTQDEVRSAIQDGPSADEVLRRLQERGRDEQVHQRYRHRRFRSGKVPPDIHARRHAVRRPDRDNADNERHFGARLNGIRIPGNDNGRHRREDHPEILPFPAEEHRQHVRTDLRAVHHARCCDRVFRHR